MLKRIHLSDINDPSDKEAKDPFGKNPYNSSGYTDKNNSDNNTVFTPSSQQDKIKNGDRYKNNYTEVNKEDISVNDEKSEIINTRLLSPFNISRARELNNSKIINPLHVKLPDCPTLEKNAAGNKKYWEVYAGPDYALENYKSYGDTASANYLEKESPVQNSHQHSAQVYDIQSV
jgi:hypothetical protein